MAMPGTPPSGLIITSCGFAVPATPTFQVLLEWENNGDYDSIELQKSADGSIWSSVTAAIDGASTAYAYVGCPYNIGTYYRVRGYFAGEGYGYTAYSNVAYRAIWYSAATDTVGVDESSYDTAEMPGESHVVDTVSAYDEVSESYTVYEEISDTVTLTDSALDVNMVRLNLARFIGTNNGKLYLFSDEIHGDAGAVMPAWWESKDVDMDDQFPQYSGKFKYLIGVKLRYIDLGAHLAQVSVSTDGGTTWTTNSKTIGNGSKTPKEKIFNFGLHGRTFMVRVFHSSSDADFQWADIGLMFEPAGDYFEVA